MYIAYYDENKKFVAYYPSSAGISAATSLTMPSKARYIRINMSGSYGNTYKHDICISLLLSGTRNGEYEAYEKASYPLDSSLTLRGIPKLDSQNNLYYDGDTYEPDGTVTRRFGIVDLGTLTWSYATSQAGTKLFISQPSDAKPIPGVNSSTVPNISTGMYEAKSWLGLNTGENAQNGITIFTDKSIRIVDSAYTDAAAFKTAMSGVYLIYELATETTETAEPFVDPQRVNDWGTEEYVCESDSDFIVPVGHDTKYRVNLRDKLQHLPDMADNDGYYLIQQIGSKMSLVNFRIPQAPATDGTYILKAIVSGGVPTYTWEAVVESTATEG